MNTSGTSQLDGVGFADLVLSDRDWLTAEFDAIVAVAAGLSVPSTVEDRR